ncbi:GNAT family N-acetyltransferase [uncultured Endozoicomonas sp.]|uniref:GNAT family N-acetyltransferase n=1 Tax=uncultured Endozoicomonas sp. TaxID=432652 RepID=UPI0026083758|nr:GNAT family N-acetyltransferase [uncultured Endozoicomonas sp.]
MNTVSPIILPDALNKGIALQPLSSNSLLVNDNNLSLLLKISEQNGIQLSPENPSDLLDSIPNHWIAAALDYLYTHNQELNNITLSSELIHRLPDNQLIQAITQDSKALNLRAGLYQNRILWHWASNNNFPTEIWTENEHGVEHPIRQQQPSGVVYERYDYQNDVTISFRTIDPEHDLDLFHQWMNQPRVAEFWEMAQSRSELQEYLTTLLDSGKTWPLIGSFNGEPFGYFEVYWAMEDRIAPYYDCQPWDRGFHLLVGNPEFLGPRFSSSWMKSITHFLYLDDPRTARLVGEPRADNKRLLKLLAHAGWSFVKEFDFPHKRSALVNGYRRSFFQEVRL